MSSGPLLFQAAGCVARELREADIPALQAFFEANPLYFEKVNGRPPRPDEAREEFHDLPPPGLPFERRWLVGFDDAASGALLGMASLLGDFLAPRVFHIGLFIVASDRHGTGLAGALYQALEEWMRGEGAAWIRLGAVVGNERAEAFWPKMGYRDVRLRHDVETGLRRSTLHVMVKCLTSEGVEPYLARVPRDRPDSALP
ncbi:GNAT family N-acetyltransferase [Aquabacterium sp.]|uniref:GNAT family N-acetyltransferase n=1 Tax=Aquabacterium sp. TaxID=1872578 RepID=UPI003783F1F2